MKRIDSYINEKLVIDKDVESINSTVDKDFKQLMNLLKKDDADEEITDDLLALADFDDGYEHLYYTYKEDLFRTFLRTIVNYDWICLRENGKIDIQNSNHKEIAKIISKYVDDEMGKRVYNSFR